MSGNKASELDIIIGKNIKFHRGLAGMNQTKLGAAMGGVTFQQVQKFESGINRVSSVQLVQASRALGVPVSDLLNGVADELPAGQSVGKGDVRFISNYKTLSPDMQESVRQLVGAIVLELAGKMGDK